MASKKYINRSGVPITQSDWHDLAKDENYVKVRRFDNGKVHVELLWYGAIPEKDVRNVLPEFYSVFSLIVKNYRENGELVYDPMSGETYPDEASAIAGYEMFLFRHGECEVDDGKFIEVNNKLAPPPPPDPDAPSQKPIEGLTDDFGAW